MGKVVKTTVYCTNSGHFSLVNNVYREYFSEDPPARTFVTVASWPMAFDILAPRITSFLCILSNDDDISSQLWNYIEIVIAVLWSEARGGPVEPWRRP